MLHIILLILKVAGIILLILLGLILAIFLTVTLVPLRYKGQGSYYGKPEGGIKITWLLHIISVAVSYKEELAVTVRLFGIRILKDRLEEPLEEALDEAEEAVEQMAGKIEEGIPSLVREGIDYTDEPMVSVQEVKPPPEDPKTKQQENRGDGKDGGDDRVDSVEEQPQAERKQTRSLNIPPQNNSSRKRILERLWGKLKTVFHRLAAFVKRMIASLKKAKSARQEFMTFITDAENKNTFHLMVRQAKVLMRHVLPRKLTGRITFGFEDPYVTGQILTGAALFYPLYQNKFSVLPVFDRKIIEGEIAFRGRIRLGVFLMAGIKILLNRNFRAQLKKFMNRGGM